MKLTPFGKLILVVIGLAIIFFGVKNFLPDLYSKLVPEAPGRKSVVPQRADLPEALPVSADAGCADKPEVRMLIWAWNAQAGALLANGGAQATKGSLMCERGVNLRFIRQDDGGKMQEDLVAFATELKGGSPNPTKIGRAHV